MLSRHFGLLLAFVTLFLQPTAQAQFKKLPKRPPIPKNNPMTTAKIELGKMLFFDPRLSRDGRTSCNSCHNVMSSGTDNTRVSQGIKGQLGGRNSPTVWNAAFQSVQFWDGRAKSLEEQAVGPLTNPIEMGMASHDSVVSRIKLIPDYLKAFMKAFPRDKNPVTIDNVGKAIAAYERTLITPGSDYDRDRMSALAKKGKRTFEQVGCISCHSGVNFSGPQLPEGVGFYQTFPTFKDNEYVDKYDFLDDEGRMAHTKNEEDKHKYRVPTLRNIALTAPYFHNGKVKTLDEAVRVMGAVQLNKKLTDDQVKEIVAFLNALTGKFPKQTMPHLPQYPNTLLGEENED